jgi:hypothetical protein
VGRALLEGDYFIVESGMKQIFINTFIIKIETK